MSGAALCASIERRKSRIARREGIADEGLREAARRAGHGLVDADLRAGLIKQRAEQGEQEPLALSSLLVWRPHACRADPFTSGLGRPALPSKSPVP
jgi:hypothetical protein